MIGETTTITGPSFRSGVIARMVELMELSRMIRGVALDVVPGAGDGVLGRALVVTDIEFDLPAFDAARGIQSVSP